MTNLPEQPTIVETVNSENPEQRPIREILIGAVGFLVFLTLLAIGINQIGVENLQAFIRSAGPAAPIIYIALKALTYIFAPLTSGPIQVVAGTLFDSVWAGVLYTVIGETLGGAISFMIARRFGRPVVARFVGEKGMEQVELFYEKRMGGWVALAVARIVLFPMWDFLSYAAGLSRSVRLSTYLWISVVLGSIPTLVFVWLGTTAIEDNNRLIMIYAIVAGMIVLPLLAHRQIAWLLDQASQRTK